jgi:hypothetical protein
MDTNKDTKLLDRVIEIHHTMNVLSTYWVNNPHLRLGQILSNAWRIHPNYKNNPEPEINDIFYLADAKFLEGLKILEELKNTNESKGSRPA